MKFASPLVSGTLIKRYKRFLADVQLDNGTQITVHCPNTGSMLGCDTPRAKVWLSYSTSPRRKYSFTWELMETAAGDFVCIHSALANSLVKEAILAGRICELKRYPQIESEVAYGDEKSRIDFLLSDHQQRCFVEVKSVTLHQGGGFGEFPDAKSERGTKHLRELERVLVAGDRALLLYAVLHTGINRVAPAREIDPDYCLALEMAINKGLEVVCYRAAISEQEIALEMPMPFDLVPSTSEEV